jgi:hypothetical protein
MLGDCVLIVLFIGDVVREQEEPGFGLLATET